jgi:hypothetical protein
MTQELVCKNMNQVFRPFDDVFLSHQRLSAALLSPRASACYTSIQDLESKRLLYDFLHSDDYRLHFERFAGSIVYTLLYSLRIETNKEWQVEISHVNLLNLTAAGQVGAWIVDALPFLNYLPGFLAPWKKTAEEWHTSIADLANTNFADGLNRPGWNWAKDFAATDVDRIKLAFDLEITCEAGIETTAVVLQIFTLACIAYPSFIPTAQAELDAVVGADRLPAFEDMDNLPYVHAIIEEVFRWRHILPTGLPHATTKDDWYNGFLIPKGATIVPLMSGMRSSPTLFPAPHEFRPERWLGGKTQSGNFGYGRRVCPGRFIARKSLEIAIARLLWGFDIRSADGKEVRVEEAMFTTGFVSHPRPFGVRFEVREGRREAVEREWERVDKDVGGLMDGVRERMVKAGLTPRA